MKKLLSLLLCYVFLQTETFALRGGPSGSGTGKVSGYYSGVMVDTGANSGSSGNMGLFLLTATGSGACTGQVVLFSYSSVGSDSYNCNMTGLSDTSRGGSGKFIGIFSGSAATSSTGTTKSASGDMTCQVQASSLSGNQTQRITGTAKSATLTVITAGAATGTTSVNPDGSLNTSVNYSGTLIGPSITYTVDGWQTGNQGGVLVLQ